MNRKLYAIFNLINGMRTYGLDLFQKSTPGSSEQIAGQTIFRFCSFLIIYIIDNQNLLSKTFFTDENESI